MMNSIKHLPHYLLMLWLFGCVGTIEDTTPDTTQAQSLPPLVLSFEGVLSVEPIAHNKVEVYFFPAKGNPTDLTYLISYDGLREIITVPGEILEPDYAGRLVHTVDGLVANKGYKFRVEVRDEVGNESANNTFLPVTTYSNYTADFYGVSALENLAGSDGMNAIKVRWGEALRTGSVFLPDPSDPAEYEVVALKADALLPSAENFDNTYFGAPSRFSLKVNADAIYTIINGLESGTRYFVRVRCIHQESLSDDYMGDPNYHLETNNKYLVITTKEGGVPEFDPASLITINPGGSLGLTSVRLKWGGITGGFDHIRIYYNEYIPGSQEFSSYEATKDTMCTGRETTDSDFYCKKVNYDVIDTTVTDLGPSTLYEFNVLVCQNIECSMGFYSIFDPKTQITDSQLASFGGITSIGDPISPDELDVMYLNYDSIDLQSGRIDGLLVRVKDYPINGIDTSLNDPIMGPPTNPDILLKAAPFDFRVSTSVKVSGINVSSYSQYCFALIPFTYVSDTEITIHDDENEIIRCKLPEIPIPDFIGLASAPDVNSYTKDITLSWAPPSDGVFTHYRIYFAKDKVVMNLEEAKINATLFDPDEGYTGDYQLIEVHYSQSSYTMLSPPAGAYKMKVVTYNSITGDYSDTYESLERTCNIVAVGDSSCF